MTGSLRVSLRRIVSFAFCLRGASSFHPIRPVRAGSAPRSAVGGETPIYRRPRGRYSPAPVRRSQVWRRDAARPRETVPRACASGGEETPPPGRSSRPALSRILYPGTLPDPAFEAPLPEGTYGCPFLGHNLFRGASFYRGAAAKLGNPRVWKFFFFGKPYACVSGLQNVKGLLGTEFAAGGGVTNGLSPNSTSASSDLFGRENLLLTTDGDLHGFLRRLVGASMTPSSVGAAVPALEKAARQHIDRMLEADRVAMDEVCTGYTLDIAWRQIIGLDLDPEEASYFQEQVRAWIEGITSWKTFFLPGFVLRRTRPFKAHRYLVAKIEEKIEALKEHGPDGSTLSAMLFAEDDQERNSKKLSRQQVIDNALLLIVAGSETSASTMTNTALCLGLNPEAWAKVKREQEALIEEHGPTLTKSQLDKDCVYLESVIKEAMRLKPIGGGNRRAEGTLIVEGKQIPKGWNVIWSIRQTHDFDPAVRVDDMSHMDLVKGFQPERWRDEATRPTEFLAFGAGPRYCLGANLAMAEMKVFLALLARTVDFDLVCSDADEIDWSKRSIVPKPADGVLVTLRPSSVEPVLEPTSS